MNEPAIDTINKALHEGGVISDDVELTYIDAKGISVIATISTDDGYNFSTFVHETDIKQGSVFPSIIENNDIDNSVAQDMYVCIMMVAGNIRQDEEFIDKLDEVMREELLSDYNDE